MTEDTNVEPTDIKNQTISSTSLSEETETNKELLTNTQNDDSSNNPIEETTNTSKEDTIDTTKTSNTTQVIIATTILTGTSTSIPITPPPDNVDQTNITLSFRQIQNFTQKENDKSISFDFYVLTLEPQSKISNSIEIYVNLIKMNGTREDDVTSSNCVLNDVKDNGYANQAHFKCSINNLNENYHSFRFNNSDSISGVPENEYSLDPYMTNKYISENKMDDVSKVGIPNTFIIKSINHDSCNKTGIFTIFGNSTQEASQPIIFSIPLREPNEGIISTCNFTKNQIECKVDRDIDNNIIVID